MTAQFAALLAAAVIVSLVLTPLSLAIARRSAERELAPSRSARVLLGLGVLASVVVAGLAYADPWLWPAVLVYVALTTAAAIVDVIEQRLPNVLTATAFVAVALLLTIVAALGAQVPRLLDALIAAAGFFAAYLLLAVVSRGGIGMGDVKLAPTVGLMLGWLGPGAALAGFTAGFVLAAVSGLALIAARRATLKSEVAFGPALIAGGLAAMLLSAMPIA